MGCIRFLFSPFAVIFGAVAMMVVAVVGFAVVQSALGLEKCYREDSWVLSDTFAAIMLGVTFLGAIIGGSVSRRTGGVLAVLLMMAFAAAVSLIPHLDSPTDASKSKRFEGRPSAPAKDTGLVDLMRWSEHPDWMRYGGALVGVTGVVFGSSLAKGGRKSRSSGDDE